MFLQAYVLDKYIRLKLIDDALPVQFNPVFENFVRIFVLLLLIRAAIGVDFVL